MIEVSSFSGNFVQVPHSFLRDKGLSSEARFLGVYLASLPSNWEVNWEQVAYEIGWSYAKVRKVAKELIEEQILEREEVRDEAGRFCGKSNTKITYKQESLFSENESENAQNLAKNDELDSSVDFSTDSSQNPSEQGLEVPTNESVHRVLQNPHTDFVQHKNKLFKEQRDFISCTREENSSQESNLQNPSPKSKPKSSQDSSQTYKIFNRTDLKLNIYTLFGNEVFKSATTNPQGLDVRGLKAWGKFVAYRRGLRAFSTLSKTRAARKFEEFYALGIDLDEAVEITMTRGWFCFWDKQGNLITGQKPKGAQRANYPRIANYQNGVQNTAQNTQKRPALDWRVAMAKAQAQREAQSKVANA